MSIEITVPRLGWSMEEGVFAGWLKKEGDKVTAGEPLFALESDKVTMEVESLEAGRLHIPSDAPGDSAIVTVGQRLGYLLADGEELPANQQLSPKNGAPAEHPDRKIFASPRARAAAKSLGIEISRVLSKEGASRIVEADIHREAEVLRARKSRPTTPNVRKVIAARMEESFRAPHFYVHDDADATSLAAFLNDLKPILEEQDKVHLTYNDLLIKALGLALKKLPRINSYWLDDAVIQRTECNIGLAVQLDDHLMVPVIRHADRLTLAEIARARAELVERCRRSETRFTDFEDGSVTLSNLGSFGVDRFQAILNPPQSTIIAVGRICKRPVVVDDAVVARLTVPISISVDHRVVDGVAAARFLKEIVDLLQSPLRLVFPLTPAINERDVK